MTDLVAGLGDTRLAGRTWSRPDWKALLAYDFTEDVMGYA